MLYNNCANKMAEKRRLLPLVTEFLEPENARKYDCCETLFFKKSKLLINLASLAVAAPPPDDSSALEFSPDPV